MSLNLNGIFKHGMVLQADKEIRIFGNTASKKVLAALRDGDNVLLNGEADADENGNFVLRLGKIGYGGPYELDVEDDDEIATLVEVYIGEVWIAGGQDNMEMPLIRTANARNIIKKCADLPIHYYKVPVSDHGDQEVEDATEWLQVTSETAPDISGICYYFAQMLLKKHPKRKAKFHVGIVQCTAFGSSVMTWQSRKALNSTYDGKMCLKAYSDLLKAYTPEELQEEKAVFDEISAEYNGMVDEVLAASPYITLGQIHDILGDGPWPPPPGDDNIRRPGGLFEGMVKRIAPFGVRGVLFYQGEEDIEDRCMEYGEIFTSMIAEWREVFDDAKLPFIYAQLPMYIAKERRYLDFDDFKWPKLRAQQYDVAKKVDEVWMAVLADCGEFDNVHPSNKKTPGERMCLLALKHVYGAEVEADSPHIIDIRKNNSGCEISFSGDFAMLVFKASFANETGFQLAGLDNIFYDCDAVVDFDGKTVVLSSAYVTEPKKIRYGWFSYGKANLKGTNGLPVTPFETGIERPLGGGF